MGLSVTPTSRGLLARLAGHRIVAARMARARQRWLPFGGRGWSERADSRSRRLVRRAQARTPARAAEAPRYHAGSASLCGASTLPPHSGIKHQRKVRSRPAESAHLAWPSWWPLQAASWRARIRRRRRLTGTERARHKRIDQAPQPACSAPAGRTSTLGIRGSP